MTFCVHHVLHTHCPNSPPPSARKPVVISIASAAALPTTLSLQPVNDARALSQPRSSPAANAKSTPRTNTTKPRAAGRPPPRTLVAIKRDLHIDGRQCGALTLGNKECKRIIIDYNEGLIDAQLASMTGLTHASPDFETVFCHNSKSPLACYWGVVEAPGMSLEMP